MPKRGFDLFGNPEGQRAMKRFLNRHPEAAGRHLDALSQAEKTKFLQDSMRQKARSKRRSRAGISQSLRFQILQRDGYRCRYCGRSPKDGVKLEIDHIIPVSKGGTNDVRNLVTACQQCNRGKSNRY